MPRSQRQPTALTIAGSDSGGGAGIQADLKTFAALGVHGTTAITCLTAQNPKRVFGIEACTPKILRQQLDAIFSELPPAAVKTGMLYSADLIRVAVDFLRRHRVPLIVDPVMVSTSGACLLKPSAIALLKHRLLPAATLATPNLAEAELLTGDKIHSPEDLRRAARRIHETFGCAALVKGGHLGGGSEAIDIFFDGKTELLLSARRVRGVKTHGTGCTYSAAITAYLALGCSLTEAVQRGKTFVTRAIADSRAVSRHQVLRWL